MQLSGGEPTIHPRFFDLLESVLADDRIGYVLINANGLLLAGRDQAFTDRLGELRDRFGRFEVYLQFDGPQSAGQQALRGADLRSIREVAIKRCGRRLIPVTLAMTVDEHNLAHLGETLRFGLERRAVRGITFQPMFNSGRGYVQIGQDSQDAAAGPGTVRRLNVADIILGLIDQSEGLLTEVDFTPLPCGDPNCRTIGYLLRRGPGGEKIVRVSDLIDFSRLQGFLEDRVNFDLEDLRRCGYDSEPLGHALRALEIGPDSVFRLFIKPSMDAWTYDQHRIDRCCVHVVGEGGRLESFCRHYVMK